MNYGKNALKLGSVCVITYLISYLFRNLLSVFAPGLQETGELTEAAIAVLSSAYMFSYAAGQLVFGIIGDYVKPKLMVLCGMTGSGLALLGFSYLSGYGILRVICFCLLGLSLSTLRGPLVKVMSENMPTKLARIGCVFISFVAYVGPLCAGLFALFLRWDTAFRLAAVAALVAAVLGSFLLDRFERRGLIRPNPAQAKKITAGEVFGIFRIESFVPYMFVGMITEISGTAISFWIPTYLTDRLGFSEDAAVLIFSAVSLSKAVVPFACLWVLHLFRGDEEKLMLTGFAVAAVFFGLMVLFTGQWLNIVLFFIALIAGCMVTSVLWSVYIPGLCRYNKVSGANGILDCSGYAAAALANLAFPFIKEAFGWEGTVLFWGLLAVVGIGIMIGQLVRRRKKQNIA